MRFWISLLVDMLFVASLASPATQTSHLTPVPQVNVKEFPAETQKQVKEAYDAARRRSDDPAAVGKLGMLLDLYNRPEGAQVCYQRAHELAPHAFRWLYFWGSLLLRNKRKQEAAPILKQGLQLRPDYLPAEFKLAEALVETGKAEEAAKLYEAAAKKYPQYAEAYYGLGRVHAAQGDPANAVALYLRACELFPKYGPAHYALAQVYRQLGQRDKAQEQLELYEQGRNIVPPIEDPLQDEMRQLDSSAVSYVERGVFLAEVGRLQDAIQATEKAAELDPKSVLAHANLVSLYGRAGNLQKAEEHYRAVLSLNPDQFPKAHYDYGVLLMRMGQFPAAETAFRRAIQIDPSYAEAHNNLGYVVEREGRQAEAMAEYRKSIESMPGFRQAHFNLGRILVNQGRYREGIEQLLQTLTPEDESTPTYLYAVGASYGRAGERQKALDYLRRARDAASARGQSKLLSDINRDLLTLEGMPAPR